jgi:hypothetical protein
VRETPAHSSLNVVQRSMTNTNPLNRQFLAANLIWRSQSSANSWVGGVGRALLLTGWVCVLFFRIVVVYAPELCAVQLVVVKVDGDDRPVRDEQ